MDGFPASAFAHADELFRTLFTRSSVPMLALDARMTCTAANDAACRMLGRPRAEIVGRPLGGTTIAQGLWGRFMREGRLVANARVRRADGRLLDVDMVAATGIPRPGSHLAIYFPRGQGTRHQALSPREQEVTRLLAGGLSGQQIAERLHLSPETVRTHIRNAMQRLHARTRSHLVALALERDLFSPDPS
jgi:PAS domain S-box-containing protein